MIIKYGLKPTVACGSIPGQNIDETRITVGGFKDIAPDS